MKRFFIYTLICSLTALMGCDKNDEVMNNLATTNGKKVTVTANIQGDAATRVTLTQNDADPTKPFVKVDWNASGETFNAYAKGGTTPIVFTQTADTEDSKNLFEGTLNGTAPYTLYYGDKEYNLSAQDGTLNEAYVLMQATATDFSTTIDFEHKTAILKPTFIKVDDAVLANNTITKIVMEGIKNPTATTESGSITVTPSALGDIYIFLPAFESYTADHTFTFIVTAGGQDYKATLTIPNGKSIEAGKFYTAAITIAAIPYLTFTAQGEQTFKMKINGENYTLPNTLQYSVGGSAWTQLTAGESIIFGGANGNLRLRGKSSTGTAKDDMDFSYIEFGNSTPVACTGDIRTLVDWKDYENAVTSSARFIGLFFGCSDLTTAPALPSTTLAEDCYVGMFRGCTSLTTAPALPATTLKNNCYALMFYGCTSLATAPTLPATTLANNCYASMFYGCTSLNSITMLATDISASDCLQRWVQNVAATGTFTKAAAMTSLPTGKNGIPEGWTVQDYSVTP